MSGWDDEPPAAAAPLAGEELGGWDAEPALETPSDGIPALKLGAKPQARDIREAMLALPTLAGARIDASEVEKLAAPTIQVLLCAFKDAARAGSPMAVISPSFVFSLAFETYGFAGDHEPFTVEYN